MSLNLAVTLTAASLLGIDLTPDVPSGRYHRSTSALIYIAACALTALITVALVYWAQAVSVIASLIAFLLGVGFAAIRSAVVKSQKLTPRMPRSWLITFAAIAGSIAAWGLLAADEASGGDTDARVLLEIACLSVPFMFLFGFTFDGFLASNEKPPYRPPL